MNTIIKAKKDLYNRGKCFTKGKEYLVQKILKNEAGLIETQVINDMNEAHIIGSWWKDFEIVEN